MQEIPADQEEGHFNRLWNKVNWMYVLYYCIFLASIWTMAWSITVIWGYDGNSLASQCYTILIFIVNLTSWPLTIVAFLFTVFLWIKLYDLSKKCCQCTCKVCCTGIEDDIEEYRQRKRKVKEELKECQEQSANEVKKETGQKKKRKKRK